MVTDLEEVFRLGTAKAAENRDFRRYLAAHHRPEEPFHILASDIQRQVDCKRCANCCRHSFVAVTPEDVERIARRLGVTPEAAAHLYTVADPDAPGQRVLASTRAGCVFLEGSLCSIYTARPKVCREFPHVAAGDHSLGSRPSSLDRWAALCPIIYNALEAYKRVTGYRPHTASRDTRTCDTGPR